MHELSIVKALIDQVHQIANKHQAKEIKMIHLQVGKLSGVEPSSLEFYFSELIKGTDLQKSQLKIEICPYRLQCNQCKMVIEQDELHMICNHCNSTDVVLIGGKELLISSVEINEASDV